jgi:hypothetical protein
MRSGPEQSRGIANPANLFDDEDGEGYSLI